MPWTPRRVGWQRTFVLVVAAACGQAGCSDGKGNADGGTGGATAGGSGSVGRGGAGGRGTGGTGGAGGATGGTGGNSVAGTGGGGGIAGNGGASGTGGVAGAGAAGAAGGGAGGRGGSAGSAGTGGAGGSGGASGTSGAAGGSGTGGAGGTGGGAGGTGGSAGGTGGVLVGPDWSAPANVDMLAIGGAANPVIAMDAAGNAIAIWRQSNAAGGVFSIHANRFTAATKTWGAPALLETDDVEGAGDVDLDVDAAGNAVVVWNQLSGRYQSVWSNRLAAGAAAWGSATLVETIDTGESMLPRVAATGGGGAVAVWTQWDGTRQSIYGSRLDPVAGWQTPQPIETSDTVEALNPDVAADADGNVVAVWEETDGATAISVRAARRDRTTGVWTAPVTLGAPGAYASGNLAFPRIALDATTGDGVAVWLLRAGAINSVWASRYQRLSGVWGGAAPLEGDDRGHASQVRIAVDGQRNAVAAWRQSDGTRFDIWASRSAGGNGVWSLPVRLDVDDGDASLPSVSAAGDGHAVVVWQQRATNLDVRASRFDAVTFTWGPPSLLDTPAAPGENPKVAVSATGLAVAVWSQMVGSAYDLLGAYHPN